VLTCEKVGILLFCTTMHYDVKKTANDILQ